MAEINNIKGIVVGQYGESLQFTIVDSNGNAVDISSYSSTKTAYLRSPDSLLLKSYTATFVSSGADGQIQFTPGSGDIDRAGSWELQFKLTSASTTRYTLVAKVEVEKAIGT